MSKEQKAQACQDGQGDGLDCSFHPFARRDKSESDPFSFPTIFATRYPQPSPLSPITDLTIMSSANKDKSPETDATASDLTALENEPVETTTEATTATTTTAKPKSPQATSPDIFDDDEDDEDLEVHPAVATTAPATTAAVPAVTSETTTATAPASAPVPAGQSEREAKLAILTEAFPSVEKEVCEFVLESHRGNVEASINALLEISDPEFQAESAAPPAPVPATALAPAPARLNQGGPPALPRRQGSDVMSQGVANMNLGGQPHEIDVRYHHCILQGQFAFTIILIA